MAPHNDTGAAEPVAGGNRKVAVKVFNVDSLAGARSRTADPTSSKRRQSYQAEKEMLTMLDHPHIVRMYECFEEDTRLYIVLEVCKGGELYTRLVKDSRKAGGGGMEEAQVKELFRQMLLAVGYLHSQNIVHRDIKTENFLLVGEKNSPQNNVLKLCDFGTATRLTNEMPRSMESIGTLSYTAPEIYNNRGATVAADCWSLGVVLYVLVTGTNPFRLPGAVNREETIKRIKEGNFDRSRIAWRNVSEPAQDQ